MGEDRDRNEVYRTMLERISAAVSEKNDPESLLDLILRELSDVSGAVDADLLLYHSDMNLLYPRKAAAPSSGWGLPDTKRSLANKALVELKTEYIPDVRESGFQSPFPGALSLLAVPIIAGGKIHGVLNLGFEKPDAVGKEELGWIDISAMIIAGLLEVVHLRETIFELHTKLIENISIAVGERDPSYAGHADRVSAYAVAIAKEMNLPERVLQDVERSGLLHDIGKIGVSPMILTKPGKLTDNEFDEVKKHTVLGRFLLKPLGFMPGVLEGIASHHERWDGEGYPRGLRGDNIPIEGRILAVAEAVDSMTTDHPYRGALSLDDAVTELKLQSGKQFDPNVVTALCSALDKGLNICN
jgi:HD-GYP domain-containing protein (c-di-GMP phosphodiesterase class II)